MTLLKYPMIVASLSSSTLSLNLLLGNLSIKIFFYFGCLRTLHFGHIFAMISCRLHVTPLITEYIFTCKFRNHCPSFFCDTILWEVRRTVTDVNTLPWRLSLLQLFNLLALWISMYIIPDDQAFVFDNDDEVGVPFAAILELTAHQGPALHLRRK